MKTDTSPRIRAYLKQVSRRLKLSKELKLRICSDLNTTITAKLEAGLSESQIINELGSPGEVAAEFNRQMADQIQKKTPLQFVCLAAAILSALVLIGKLVIHFLVTDLINDMTRSVGIIGGADGPTSIFITTSVSNRSIVDFFIWLAVLIIGIIGYVLLKRKANKEDQK